MKKMDLRFDLILSSPFLRAKQTAEIIAESLTRKKQLAFSDAPYLSQLIALLTAGETGVAIELKKGGLGKLEAEFLLYGRCAKLVWLLTPRQMELMT